MDGTPTYSNIQTHLYRQLTLGSDCNATQFSLFDAERNPVIRRAVAVRNDEVGKEGMRGDWRLVDVLFHPYTIFLTVRTNGCVPSPCC